MKKLKKVKNFINSWPGTILIFILITSFIMQSFRIPSGSMKDTLLVGDMLFGSKFSYGIPTPYIPFLEIPIIPGTDGHLLDGDEPKRGDIVIFRYPKNHKMHFVKRCIGLPGDELFIKNKILYIHFREGDKYIEKNYKKNNIIELNNKKWVGNPYRIKYPGIHNDEHIKYNGNPQMMPLFNTNIIKVPKKEYFMMGDNRDHSNDSRFWGTVPYGLLEGKPLIIWFSISNNWHIRFDRIFKIPSVLEKQDKVDEAVKERKLEDKNNKIT